MSTPPMPKERAKAFFAHVHEFLTKGHPPPGMPLKGKAGAVRMAAEAIGYQPGSSASVLQRAVKIMGKEPDWSAWSGSAVRANLEVPKLPDYQANAEEIIQRKFRIFNRRKRAQDARDLIRVNVKTEGPIGILHMGDPHLDDDGTNIQLVMDHLDLAAKTDGMFLACVGDYLNNWRGKLAYLHAMQTTTQQEAYKLLEWFLKRDKWLYLIGGNHDVWNGNEDPLIWFTRGLGAVYEWHGARIGLRWKGGHEQFISVRHDFPGHSQYNKAFGATKAIFTGGTDDLYINGHRHESAHHETVNSAGGWSHAVQVASYKQVDDFPRKLGKMQSDLGAACVSIHDPNAASPHGRCEVFWDVHKAARYLTYLRQGRKVAA